MQRLIVTLVFAVACCLSATAQSVKISGIVRSVKDSSVIAGAAVFKLGTRNGTATVSSGFYSITAKMGDTLLFTALGKISQRIVVGAGKDNVNIYMQDAENTS